MKIPASWLTDDPAIETTAAATPHSIRPGLNRALRLANNGWVVLPAKPGKKTPWVAWADYQNRKPTDQEMAGWFNRNDTSYWIACGSVSDLMVLDIDSDQAEAMFRQNPEWAAVLDSTRAVKTAKGRHYYFALNGDRVPSWSTHNPDTGVSFDLRAEGTGVIGPGSIHETGVIYEWINPDAPIQPYPTWLSSLRQCEQESGIQLKPPSTSGVRVGTDGAVRSLLSKLLLNPPTAGGRNDWLARVAGHYAKAYRNAEDLYRLHCELANQQLPEPLDDDERDKTVDSVWRGETIRHPERDATPHTGWLTVEGDSARFSTPARVGSGETAQIILQPWSDFALRVNGVIQDPTDLGKVVYDLTVYRDRNGRRVESPLLLPGQTLGDNRALAKLLAGYGCSITRPDDARPRNPADNIRLLQWIEAQDAPVSWMVRSYGWDERSASFIWSGGVITAGGPGGFHQVRPDPTLTGIVNFHYGSEGADGEANAVLREICTYHDELTVALYGAWWAACLLKPQISAHTALFPFVGVEATSGSGKSTGFFPKINELAGNATGAVQGTTASIRDMIAANKSGIVWIDDLDDLERIEELLRASTVGETLTKKAYQSTSSINVQLVAPIVVSGEHLGLQSQKALLDRMIQINPSRPDDRRSLKPGQETQPQYDDIIELELKYGPGGLTQFAGTLVSQALELQSGVVAQVKSARTLVKQAGKGGRQADKFAILIAGGWLLDRLCDPGLKPNTIGPHQTRVLDWVQSDQSSNGQAGDWDNRVTLHLVPWALMENRWESTPIGGAAAFVEDDLVYVAPRLLEDLWLKYRRGDYVPRTDSHQAILEQLRRIPGSERERRSTTPGTKTRNQVTYWKLPAEVSRVVLQRSRGD